MTSNTDVQQRSVIMTGSWKSGVYNAKIHLPAGYDYDELETMMDATRDIMSDIFDYNIEDSLMRIEVGIHDNGDLQVPDIAEDARGVLVMVEAIIQNIESV